ncbi:MAG: hypothetical protein ACI4B6_09715, partial [Atopobiaceae bacterium]
MRGEKRERTYGVFDPQMSQTAGRAVAMGTFVGSSWAVAAIACWAVGSALAGGGISQEARWIVSVVLGMLAGGVLQQLWFNFVPSMRLSYARRIAGFGVTYFVVLAGCAVLGEWLPVGIPLAWAGFAGLYLVVLAVLTVVFTVALRRRSSEYQRALDRFHRN